MPLKDAAGKAWAHRSGVRAGDKLRTDGGFTCLTEGEIRLVKMETGRLPGCSVQPPPDDFSRLYIDCGEGRHYLEGQIGDDGELVGLYRIAAAVLLTGAEWLPDVVATFSTIAMAAS